MADFILIATIVFAFFALIWKCSDAANTIIKLVLLVMVVWGMYLLFGPVNAIAQLAR